MTRLSIAPVARSDLRDIRKYSKTAFGARVTAAYLVGLRASFESLVEMPLIGREETDLGDGLRSLGYRSHRIYYRAVADELIIVRILHQARDVAQAFDGQP